MIRSATATRQVLRMSVQPGFPQTSEGQDELENALKKSAASDEHAVRIIDAWLASSRFCATPYDLYELAETVPAVDFTERPDKRCSGCSGTGYEQVWQLITWEHFGQSTFKSVQVIEDQEKAMDLRKRVDGKDQVLYDCVRRCQRCSYGRALQAAEQSREVV